VFLLVPESAQLTPTARLHWWNRLTAHLSEGDAPIVSVCFSLSRARSHRHRFYYFAVSYSSVCVSAAPAAAPFCLFCVHVCVSEPLLRPFYLRTPTPRYKEFARSVAPPLWNCSRSFWRFHAQQLDKLVSTNAFRFNKLFHLSISLDKAAK
jgi:hypothetical protein